MQLHSCHSIEKLGESSELVKIKNKNNNLNDNDGDEIDSFLENIFTKILTRRQKNRKQSHRVFKKSYFDGGKYKFC